MDREKVMELVESIIIHAEDEQTRRSWDSDDVGWKNTDRILYSAQQLKELLKEQDKLVNVDKLREELGFAESCEKCKKDSWRCQRDTYFTEMDFCNRLDLAIEELTQEGR